jgi:hypothetical protein
MSELKDLTELVDRITLKKVKYHRGHDGMSGLNCDFYFDGKFIAHVFDDAWGGGNQYDQCMGQDKKGMPIMSQFDWKILKEYDTAYIYNDTPLNKDWDCVLNDVLQIMENKKRDKEGIIIAREDGYAIWKPRVKKGRTSRSINLAKTLSLFGDKGLAVLQGGYDEMIADGEDVLNKPHLASLGIKV